MEIVLTVTLLLAAVIVGILLLQRRKNPKVPDQITQEKKPRVLHYMDVIDEKDNDQQTEKPRPYQGGASIIPAPSWPGSGAALPFPLPAY